MARIWRLGKSEAASRFYLILLLGMARVHYPVKRAYYAALSHIENKQRCRIQRYFSSPDGSQQDRYVEYRSKTKRYSDGDHDDDDEDMDTKFKFSSREDKRDSFPHQHWLISLTQRISTVYHALILLKNIFPWKYMVDYLRLDKPYNCYSMGRFVMNLESEKLLCTILCILQIIWRFSQLIAIDKNQNCIIFLYSRREFLRRQYYLIDRNYKGVTLTSMDLMMRNVLCYPLRQKTRIIYKLRANRTLDYHHQLRAKFRPHFLWALAFYAFLFVVFLSLVFYEIFFDINYVQAYPNCSPELDALYHAGNLGAFTITKVNWHKMLTYFVDGFTNLFLWVDIGFAAVFPFTLMVFLDDDIVFQWHDVRSKAENLLWSMKFNSLVETNSRRNLEATNIEVSDKINDYLLGSDDRRESRNNLQLFNKHNQYFILEDRVNDIQTQLIDFYGQMNALNTLIADILTIGFTIWFVSFSTSTYVAITYDIRDKLYYFRMGQAALCAVFIFAAYPLMKINRSTNKSYGMICSLMALDKSRYKKRFTKVLDYHTKLTGTCYSYFGNYPLTHNSYLYAISYTISCWLVVENLFLRTNRVNSYHQRQLVERKMM